MKKIYLNYIFIIGALIFSGSLLAQTTTFNFTGTSDTYMVPAGVTTLTIDARGAQGGRGGGLGAMMSGDVAVTPGETLKILVGGQGIGGPNDTGSGGGGGSFVTTSTDSPLIIAGGGGGTGHSASNGSYVNIHGVTGLNGQGGQFTGAGSGGTGGNGGQMGSTSGGIPNNSAGGGGLLTDGGGSGPVDGGDAFIIGGLGGMNSGGFGGGGGGTGNIFSCGAGNLGGSGGGGYSGGGGGGTNCNGAGGGGGSINTGSNQVNAAGFQTGNGQILITPLVVDNPPTAVCTDFTAQLDAAGNATITAANVDGGSTDAEGAVTLAVSQTAFTCANVGPNTVTLTVTDSSGQTDTCTATVFVEDTMVPTVITQNSTVQLDAAGQVTVLASAVDNGSSDNCGITTIAFGEVGTTFAEVNEGQNLTITAPAGTLITSVDFASYGTPTGSNGMYTIGACHAANSVTVVEGFALGNNTFTVPANNGTFGDPCFGTPKRLFVTVGYSNLNPDITFTCADVGPNVVNLVVIDVNGNSATAPATITVEDSINPVVTCLEFTTTFTGCPDGLGPNTPNGVWTPVGPAGGINNAVGGSFVSFLDLTTCVSDNCNTLADLEYTLVNSYEENRVPGCSVDLINEFEIRDVSGNVATTTIIFRGTIESGVTPPTITCPADITVNNDAGVCGAVVTYTTPVGSDTCGATTTVQTAGFASGATFPIGTTTNTFLATDGCGNTATCSFDVTVNDTEDPVIACPADITVNNDPGLCSAVVDYEITSSSIIFSESFVQGVPSGDCGAWNTFQGQLLNGLSYTSLTISGSMDPVGISLNDPAKVLQLADALRTNSSVTVVDGPNTWRTGGCGAGTEISVNQGICSCASNYSVRPCIGNSNANWGGVNGQTCGAASQTMTVEFVHSVGGGPIVGMDNCPGSTTMQTAGLPSGSIFPVGTTTNTFVVTDASGNTATCSFDVTVVDNEPPVAVCMDITIQLDVNGDASIVAADVDGGSTDNCGIASLAISPSTFTCADVGPNNVTLTVTDIHGNVSTCIAIVTVEDNIPPVAVCLNIDAFLDASGSVTITAADVDGGSTDACGIASLAIDIDTFTCDADLGPNDVTLTVTDSNGNVSTCIAVVTVIDAIDPVIACPADIAVDTTPGDCFTVVTFPDALALDNCTVTVAQTGGLPSGSMFPVGVNTVEYTATDSSGNTAVCTFTITVTDNELPVAVCMDITIQLDANGDATIIPADIDGGSTDNCGIASLDASQTVFDCSDVGPNDITLTVTDVNGNVSTCIAVVTVEDNVDPVAVCMDITVELDVNGTVTIVPADIDGGSSDACGIANLEIDIDTFTCADVGENTVTLTVTDNNGNMTSCTAIVTVEDNIAPDLVCMDITVELDENGEAEIVPEDVMATNTDACGILVTGIDIFQFDCDDIGTPVTVTVFSQDNNGNLSSCMAVVTVVDLLAPIVTCPADITVDPGAGNQFYVVPDYYALGEASATDNCTDPLTIFGQDPAAGTLLPDGVYTITMSATDESGNVGTCEFELTVESILGVNDNGVDISTIVMYPNPAINVVNISNPQNIELEQAAIYDVTGRLVQTYDLKDMGTEKALDISMLSTATYVVMIQGPEGQVTKQLIKE